MYADIYHSADPPAAPPPTELKPIVYAYIQQSTNPPTAPPPTQPVVYADIHHSTNQPAAPPLTELKAVVYATVEPSTNSSDAPLSSEYDDIGHHVEMMDEAVQETCPTPYKGQCHVSRVRYFYKHRPAHVN